MPAYELIIDSKLKSSPFAIVSADDFQSHTGRHLDPHVILERPTVSLYCLDHDNRRALFVDTSPETNLLQAPFYFIAQYEAAQRLISVPYDILHTLAREVDLNPERIILLYSTGRCGSTLLSHVMNLNPAVVSFSEPDVFSQLVMLRTSGQSDDAEVASLLYDSLMIMSANAQQRGFQYWAFKFRSYVLSVSDLLYRVAPKAKILFLYRNGRTWARSFSRAFGLSDAQLERGLVKSRYLIPSVNVFVKTNTRSISWLEYLANMWVSTMRDSNWLKQQRAAIACARFEDLKVRPQAVIQSLLTHCELPLPDPNQLAKILARDSQTGTAGAQDRGEPARLLTDDDLAKLERIIRELDPGLAPDTILR